MKTFYKKFLNYKENQEENRVMDLEELYSETIIEPFRIRSVEPIQFTTMQEREELLKSRLQSLFAESQRCFN